MLILLVLLIFFAALGIPLAFAIGASCVTYILIYAPTFITMLPQRVWNGAYSELMIAMPLFMLAGELMNTGGITQRIINFCMVSTHVKMVVKPMMSMMEEEEIRVFFKASQTPFHVSSL